MNPLHSGFAISIRQPYAELILLGRKTAEFRSRPTARRGWLWLYAPKTLADNSNAWDEVGLYGGEVSEAAAEQLTGMLVGAVRIDESNRIREDSYAYALGEARRLPETLAKRTTYNGTTFNRAFRPQPLFWRPHFLDRQLERECLAAVQLSPGR